MNDSKYSSCFQKGTNQKQIYITFTTDQITHMVISESSKVTLLQLVLNHHFLDDINALLLNSFVKEIEFFS